MNKSKKISSHAVYKIKASHNPAKFIADGIKIGDLHLLTYTDKVELFRNRIQEWYFKATKPIEATHKSNFVLMAISCLLIDLLSQYRYGKEHSNRQVYMRFFKEYLQEYNHRIDPPIETCSFDSSSKMWIKTAINSVAEGFYHGIRCGILHSARIMEYCRLNRYYEDEIVKVIEWDATNHLKEINIHAPAFFHKLEDIFRVYIEKLRDEEEEIKINFLKRFNFDYGIIEEYKGVSLKF